MERVEFTEEQLAQCVGLSIATAAGKLDSDADPASVEAIAAAWPEDVDEDALTVGMTVAMALAAMLNITTDQLYAAASAAIV